ncbi:MAG: chemotaxis protein CheW [Sedimentisphaerales bacterium]|jgi:hypothetical protein
MERTQNLLFITFVFNEQGREPDIRCCGCKEMMFSNYKKPTHIKGIIEFEGRYVPVVDPSIWLCGEPTHLAGDACILVVEHSFEHRQLKTAILIPDSEEVMNLAAGVYGRSAPSQTSFNMRFVLEISKNTFANKFLADTHLALSACEERKRMEDDFTAFRKIVSRGLVFA